MSCCTIKKDTNSSIKEFDLLKSKFDIVELEDKERYRVLILKDKAKTKNIDYIVWLQVKIAYGSTNGHSNRDDNELLTSACKSISDWVDILKDFDKSSNQSKQLSLFDEPSENDELELEVEPESPSSEGNWGKYFRDSEKIRRNNAMKKYTFFELCDLTSSYFIYHDADYRHLLPKSSNEMIELIKEAIIKGTSSEKGYGRFDGYWWDDEYNYMCRDGALSDVELIYRVQSLIRLYLVPYTKEFHVWGDDSYSMHEHEKSISHRFWFDRGRVQYYGSFDDDKKDLPEYDLNTPEFIQWCREFFNIDYKEIISDEDILKENIKSYFASCLGYENFDNKYNFFKKIQTLKDWKHLKADILSFLDVKNINSNGGGGGVSLDGFHGWISRDRKGNIKIEQDLDVRLSVNRSIDNQDGYDNRIIVYDISGDDLYKKAFELFSNQKRVVQTSLFDFDVAT